MKDRTLLLAIALLCFTTATLGQEARPYKEGPVVEISYIKVKPGKFDDYMKFLSTSYKDVMEANKKAGLVTSYGVFANRARTPQDADLLLTTTYPNWAALDRVEEGLAVAARVTGSQAVQNRGFIDRGAMREVLGSSVVQELILK